MLHVGTRCMPPRSYTRLGKDGNSIFEHGPIVVHRGDSLKCVAMSMTYAKGLEAYIESQALTPLIAERGSLDPVRVIGRSSHTDKPVGAVAPAGVEWNALYCGSRTWTCVVDIATRPIGSEHGPQAVLHHGQFCFVKEVHVASLAADAEAIAVYFLFRKEPSGSETGTTLIGILAGQRQAGEFDPYATGPFFTTTALQKFYGWQRQSIERYEINDDRYPVIQ